MYRLLLTTLFLTIGYIGISQTPLVVKTISIKGHGHTKEYIIHKELDFEVGDTLWRTTIDEKLNKSKHRLYDTKLFNIVNISYRLTVESDTTTKSNNTDIDILIYLEKSWYLFPSPIFDVEAENLTTWWKKYNCDLSWVSYGIRLDHINLTGNQDILKAIIQTGYTHKYELEYSRPYVLKSKIGIKFNAYYTENNNVGYKTQHNKVLYWDSGDTTALKRFRLSTSLIYRFNIYWTHSLDLQYHHNTVNKKLSTYLNPDYFLNQKNNVKFILLEYKLNYDKRVFKLYPHAGYAAYLLVKKEGVGLYNDINLFKITMGYEQYYQTKKEYILQFAIEGKTEINRSKTPYANYSAIGYGDNFIRGYEFYILDGLDYILNRNSIRKSIYKSKFDFGKWMPLKPYKKIPIEVYLRFNLEAGYVNDPFYKETNILNNQLLIGYGPAVDIILYNNILLSAEYNFNKLGEHNLFLHNIITLNW